MCPFQISHRRVMTFIAQWLFFKRLTWNPQPEILCDRPPLFNNISQSFWSDPPLPPQSPDHNSAPLCRGRTRLYHECFCMNPLLINKLCWTPTQIALMIRMLIPNTLAVHFPLLLIPLSIVTTTVCHLRMGRPPLKNGTKAVGNDPKMS